jgi:hypothetical protein
MYLSDITNYNKPSDYLSILNGIFFVNIIIMLLVFHKIISLNIIHKWYTNYKLYASMVDITTIFLVIILTRYIYSFWKQTNNSYGFTYSWSVFIIIAIFSQICFDLFMYVVIQTIPNGTNQMVDIFRRYIKEDSVFIFTFDCLFVLFSILFASIFNTYNINTNIIILIILLNILPFILFTN